MFDHESQHAIRGGSPADRLPRWLGKLAIPFLALATGCSLRASAPPAGLAAAPPAVSAAGQGFIELDPDPAARAGYLVVRVALPEERRVESFPTTTTRFILTVTAADMAQPVTATIARPAGAQSATTSLTVPVGANRTLSVTAKNASGKTVASGSASGLTVSAGVYSPVTVTLLTSVGNVTGTVISRDTDLPLAGVSVVSADGQTATTDGSGNFTLTDVNTGTQNIEFSLKDHVSGSLAVEIAAGATAIATPQALARQHWSPVGSGTSNRLRWAVMRSATESFVGGNGGTILHSVDGGSTWVQVNVPNATSVTYNAQFVDAKTAFAATGDGAYATIWVTSDGGLNWSSRSLDYPFNSKPTDLVAASSQSIHTVGTWGYFYASSDGWASAKSYDTPTTFWQLIEISPSQFWAASEGKTSVFSTGSGGSSWQTLTIPATVSAEGYRPMAAWSAMNACVAGYHNTLKNGAVACTQNGGPTWDMAFRSTSSVADTLRGMVTYGTSGYCAVGENALIVIQPSAGANWSVSPANVSDPQNYKLNAVAFYGTSAGIAVGDGGRILRY